MAIETVNILLVDDDEDDFVIVKDLLADIKHTRFHVVWEPTYEGGLEKITAATYDVYLIDYLLGEKNGLDLLREAVRTGCKSPVIMLTGQGHPEVDHEAMRIGASDYMVKGTLNAHTIERSIRYALSHTRTLVQLYEQEKKYRQLFEQSVNAIYLTDQAHAFTDANPVMLLLFGYSHDEITQRTLQDLFARQEDYTKFYEVLTSSGQVKNLEVLMKTKVGAEVECTIKTTSLQGQEGASHSFQGIIEDISERNIVQQEMIRMEKLSMTGNIARSIAHEIRNPLTNINLALEQFATELPKDDTLDIYFNIIRRNTHRINQLITEMLNSSKPSQLNLEKQYLHDVLDRTVKLAKDRSKLMDVKLTLQYDKALEPLMVDKEKLAIAFLNIVTNAIEAVEAGKGHIYIETRQQQNKQYVVISDNGAGIAKDNLTKLFDAFHTGKRGGMGLGLTSTQNVINAHKAKILVESVIGEGTVFTIIFDTQMKINADVEC